MCAQICQTSSLRANILLNASIFCRERNFCQFSFLKSGCERKYNAISYPIVEMRGFRNFQIWSPVVEALDVEFRTICRDFWAK
jgi:hypothetical protein